jgi:hypothetical protein
VSGLYRLPGDESIGEHVKDIPLNVLEEAAKIDERQTMNEGRST